MLFFVTMGLKQHVSVPTHISGHTLDLVITRAQDPVVCSIPVADRYLSDHASVLCSLNAAKSSHVTKEICYRRLKAIEVDQLRADLQNSDLCQKEYADLNELSLAYTSTLSSLLDKHAPLQKKTSVVRQRVPWFNSEIKDAIRSRRKAKRKWRKFKSSEDLRAFKSARNHATYIMNFARRDYYSQLISENSADQRKLFRTTKSLYCVSRLM